MVPCAAARLALADLNFDRRRCARNGACARVVNDAHQARLGRRGLVPLAAQPPVLGVYGHLPLARLAPPASQWTRVSGTDLYSNEPAGLPVSTATPAMHVDEQCVCCN